VVAAEIVAYRKTEQFHDGRSSNLQAKIVLIQYDVKWG
jgi:hypothetical protein